MNYEDFIASKRLAARPVGIEPPSLNTSLFAFQADIVRWALRLGRAAIWADCGLGKSLMALEWSRAVHEHTNGDVLIATPLAVARQFVSEGEKFGIQVTHCRTAADVKHGINVTNYERLHHFDAGDFAAFVADEASVLKDYTSKTRNQVIEMFAATPFRLATTATPAPNDHMELGNHAEFLGVMSRTEMLAMFFTHDGGSTQDWRLKGHARAAFWRWVASWAAAVRRPSDLGYPDEGFALPPLGVHEVVVASSDDFRRRQGALFTIEARGLSEQRDARRSSLGDRVAATAEIVNADPGEQWLVFCDLNDESKQLAAAIPGAVEVAGSDSVEFKEAALIAFVEYQRLRECKRKNSEGCTCGSGSKEIATESESTEPPRQGLETPAGVKSTRQTRPSGRKGGRQVDGEIATRSETIDSEYSSESAALSSTQSSQNKVADVRSADASRTLTPATSQDVVLLGSTSTTAMQQATCAACSARRAILGLESSETIPRGLSGQPDISDGIRVLVSKPSIAGKGMNFQNAARMAFVGLSHSFEAWYQAIRREWRFGQKRPVHCYVITSEAEGAVVANLKRKQAEAEAMTAAIVGEMKDFATRRAAATARDVTAYEPQQQMSIPAWIGQEARR